MAKELSAADKAKRDAQRKEKFKELATARVSLAITKIRGISKLSGKNYSYTSEQAGKIVTALVGEVNRVRDAFAGKVQDDSPFTM